MVPTTLGFTSATPNAGSASTNATSTPSGTVCRTGASHAAPSDPSRKYAHDRIRYASASALRNPIRSASVPPKTGRNHTSPPKNPVSVPALLRWGNAAFRAGSAPARRTPRSRRAVRTAR